MDMSWRMLWPWSWPDTRPDAATAERATLRRQVAELTKAVVHLEATREEWGPTLRSLEEQMLALRVELASAGNSQEYNSYYINRVPHYPHHFKSWTAEDAAGSEGKVRDREFHNFYDQAMAFVSSGAPTAPQSIGDYYEFGCCGTSSLRMALSKAKKWGLEDMRFHVFDSFQGLPTDGTLKISQEAFWADVKRHGVNADKVTATPGWYSESLTEDLQKVFLAKDRRAALIMVDCDLYDSAVPVFKFIAPLCRSGTIIFIDDYWVTFHKERAFGTAGAFFEFVSAHPTLAFHPFMKAGWWGMSFIAYERDQFRAPVI